MRPIAIYALVAVLLVPVYAHFVSPNEFSRWVLAAAIVEDGSLEVSRQAAVLGPRFEDLSAVDGRLYSNKPPGLGLVSLPGYVAARGIAGGSSIRAAVYAMRIVGSTIPLLLLAVTMIAVGRKMNVEVAVEPAVFTLLFATPLFAYGMLLFSHALVAACLFGAWALLFPLDGTRRSELFAGALIGLAVLSESAAVFPAIILVLAAIEKGRLTRALRVIAGGVPLALVYGAYNDAAFGSPFQLSHFHEKSAEFQRAAETFGMPSIRAAADLLLGPERGLFVFAPVLALSLMRLGAVRERLSGRAFAALLGVPLASLVFAASYVNWHGGWTVGPRYIVAAVPFLVLPLLFTPLSRTEAFLIGWSAAAVVIATTVFPFTPEGFPIPWGTFSLPLLGQGLAAPNLFHLSGLPFAGLGPLVLCAAALGLSVDRRTAAAAILGVIAAILIGVAADRAFGDTPIRRLQRGYIADVYFAERGSLEASAGGLDAVPPGLLRRRLYERSLPPPEWQLTD